MISPKTTPTQSNIRRWRAGLSVAKLHEHNLSEPAWWYKTEFLLIGNELQQSKYLSMFPIELLGVKTYPAKSARNHGGVFDKTFNFRSHISAICSSCVYHIRDLRRIRHHIDLDSAKVLANALVSSRLDYCNSVLSGVAETDLTKLQHILNRLARVVTKNHHHLLAVFHRCALFIGYQ